MRSGETKVTRPGSRGVVRASKAASRTFAGASAYTWLMSCGRMRASTTSISLLGTTSRIGAPAASTSPGAVTRSPMTTPSTGERIDWRSTWSLRGTQAFFDLAQPRRRLLELIGGRLLISIARVGHARAELGGSLARQRQFAARFVQPAAVVGVGPLQRQQPRARHVTFA